MYHLLESWIFILIILIISSTGLYLCIRHFKEFNISNRMQSLVMFLPTALLSWIIAYINWIHLLLDQHIIILMLPIAIVFSWFSNRMSLLSLEKASNPWYSLIISKSYVILTTILAVPLFKAQLHFVQIFAICVIIFFSLVLILSQSKNKSWDWNIYEWLMPAIYCFFWRSWLALSGNWLVHQWIHPLVINFRLFLFVSCMIISEWIIKWHKVYLPRSLFPSALWIVFFAVIYNRATQTWYKLSPNPWFVNAANASSIALLALLSALLFNDKLSIKGIIWIVWIILGISVLFIY